MNLFDKLAQWAACSDNGYHAPYSPSKLDLLKKCRHFVSKPTTSEAAKRGTGIHEAIAYTLIHKEFAANLAVDAVAPVNNAIEWLIRQAVINNQLDTLPKVSLFVEQRLYNSIPGTDGTADIVAIYTAHNAHHALIVDWKSGYATYDAPTMLQIKAYALGLLELGVIRVKCVIVPVDRVSGPLTEDAVSQVLYTQADVPSIRQQIAGLIQEVTQADRIQPQAGYYCKWCDKAATCPALGNKAVSLNMQHFAELHAKLKQMQIQYDAWKEILKQNPELLTGSEFYLQERSGEVEYNTVILKEILPEAIFDSITAPKVVKKTELAAIQARLTDDEVVLLNSALEKAKLSTKSQIILKQR